MKITFTSMGHVQSIDVESVVVPIRPPENENESWTYVNNHVLMENGGKLMRTFFGQPDARTPIEVMQGSATKWPDWDCLGEREILPDGTAGKYVYISYKDAYARFLQFGRGLRELGLKKGDKIGIYAHNSIWWQTIAFGCYSIGVIAVPVYDSLGPQASEYIVNHADIEVLFVSGFKLKNAIKLVPKIPNVKKLVLMSDKIPEDIEKPSIPLVTCQEILDNGATTQFQNEFPEPDDLALIMYTSGSTGTPKGCVLTHANIIAGGTGLSCVGISCTAYVDTYLSFLPLAHIYAQAVELEVLAHGGRVGYARGPVALLIDDIQALQPTIMTAVPRILNTVAEKMQAQINKLPAPVRMVMNWAMKEKVKCMKENRPQSLILDAILFSKFRAALGGKMRVLISGGAPIMPEIFEFFSAAVTPNILQGCGLTELSSSCFVQELPVQEPDTVGLCCPCIELKLRRIPEMPNYNPQDPEEPSGEVLARGPNLFQGYYKQPEVTAESMVDGWLATGDVVKITKTKQIKVIDRVKQLVKLENGEYISLTTLTECYTLAEGIGFIFVYADAKHAEPIAIVWPSPDMKKKWESEGISDITTSPKVHDEIITSLGEAHQKRNLRKFEKINHVLVHIDDPTVENGLLTPSLKAQYNKIKVKYFDELNALYDKISTVPKI